MPDFTLADAEFDKQASILDALVRTIDVLAKQDSSNRLHIGIMEVPLIPSGGQNTMGAAAVVLLASHFEEYVRQQVEEYAKAIILDYAYFEENFRDRFVDSYWRSGASKLANFRPKKSPTWASEAAPLLSGLLDYPVNGNSLSFRSEYICMHENNMRWDTICDLAGRVGIKSLGERLFKSKKLKNFLNNPRKDVFTTTLEREISSFYELRNGIVHSISHHVGIGVTIVARWSEFFQIFTTAFAEALVDAFEHFEREIGKRKHAASI